MGQKRPTSRTESGGLRRRFGGRPVDYLLYRMPIGVIFDELELPLSAHRCLIGPDQESKEGEQQREFTRFPDLFANVRVASSNLVSCSIQNESVTRSVAGSFCIQSLILVLVWSLGLKNMPTEGGAESE
jgi:hypothetical protein